MPQTVCLATEISHGMHHIPLFKCRNLAIQKWRMASGCVCPAVQKMTLLVKEKGGLPFLLVFPFCTPHFPFSFLLLFHLLLSPFCAVIAFDQVVLTDYGMADCTQFVDDILAHVTWMQVWYTYWCVHVTYTFPLQFAIRSFRDLLVRYYF